MVYLSGTARTQLLLLPEAIDDYVGLNNPVRFIEVLVDGVNLQVAGFARVHAKTMGRPSYDPADLLKLYIYGYLNRVRERRERHKALLAELDRIGEDQISLTDPDARAMAGVTTVAPDFSALLARIGLTSL